MTRAIDQTLALFQDAYRELNSRKLFWFSLAISGFVVVVFAGVGISGDKLSFFGFGTPFPAVAPLSVIYKLIFSNFGVGIWLTFLGMILALISTAGVFPDLITGGTVDLYLSKPITRVRLFVTKYLAGLMFAALQVTVFCAACWLLMGLRAHVWSARVFVAIPLVVCVFSYLFSVQVLVGLMTRSAIAAILVTAIFWGLLFGLDFTERTVLSVRAIADQAVRKWDRQHPPTRPASTAPSARSERANLVSSAEGLAKWHRFIYGVKTVLPKTHETNEVLDRALLTPEERDRLNEDHSRGSDDGPVDREAAGEIVREQNHRTAPWAIGTSLLFELVVVSLAAWVFCRRDY